MLNLFFKMSHKPIIYIMWGKQMNHEDKAKVDLLKKSLSKSVKQKLKPFGFKQKDFTTWTVQNGYFFEMFPYISVPDNSGKATFTVKYKVKPLYVDDLLWDVMGMELNKSEPLSLRAIGAFSLSGLPFHIIRREFETLELEELEQLVDNASMCFNQLLLSAKEKEEQWFEELETQRDFSREYHATLMRAILLLYSQKYDETIAYLQNNVVSGFNIGGKTISQMINKYCSLRL